MALVPTPYTDDGCLAGPFPSASVQTSGSSTLSTHTAAATTAAGVSSRSRSPPDTAGRSPAGARAANLPGPASPLYAAPPRRADTFEGLAAQPPLPTTTRRPHTSSGHRLPHSAPLPPAHELPQPPFLLHQSRAASYGGTAGTISTRVSSVASPPFSRPSWEFPARTLTPHSLAESSSQSEARNFSLPVGSMQSQDSQSPTSPTKRTSRDGPTAWDSSDSGPHTDSHALALPDKDRMDHKHESFFEIFSAYEDEFGQPDRDSRAFASGQSGHRFPDSYGSHIPATIDEDLPNFDAVRSDRVVSSLFDPQLEAARRLRKTSASTPSSRPETPPIDSAIHSPAVSTHTSYQPGHAPMHRYQSLPNIAGQQMTQHAFSGLTTGPEVESPQSRAGSTVQRALTMSPAEMAYDRPPVQPGWGASRPNSRGPASTRWASNPSPTMSPPYQARPERRMQGPDLPSMAALAFESKSPPARPLHRQATAPIRVGLLNHSPRSGKSATGSQSSRDRDSIGNPPRSTASPPGQRNGSISGDISSLVNLRTIVRTNPTDHASALRLVNSLAAAGKVTGSAGGDERLVQKQREALETEGVELAKRLISAGFVPAMYYLAECYSSGNMLGITASPREAFTLFQSAAKHGHGPSAYRTGLYCELGLEGVGGGRRDPLQAVQWYRQAAAAGEVRAMFRYGMLLLYGQLGQTADGDEGINWLQRAADRADRDCTDALHELAKVYENPGAGQAKVICDPTYALELYQKAAELGNKFSMHRLGQAYQRGELAVEIDDRLSIVWYTRAAALGEHESELALSGWYLIGAPGLLDQSDLEAYLWARKAARAEPPVVNALFAMGYYSERGIGCPPDMAEARRWYGRAAGFKDAKAVNRLDELDRATKPAVDKGSPKSREKLRRSGTKTEAAPTNSKKEDCVVM